MQIRRLFITIAIAAALFTPQILLAQTQENHFDKNNPYTQLLPQPKDVTYDLNAKPFVLDKNTVIVIVYNIIGVNNIAT